jgi:hypothetical protein
MADVFPSSSSEQVTVPPRPCTPSSNTTYTDAIVDEENASNLSDLARTSERSVTDRTDKVPADDDCVAKSTIQPSIAPTDRHKIKELLRSDTDLTAVSVSQSFVATLPKEVAGEL